MVAWDDFFAAQVGASAALAGLLFVGLSLNLAKVVATKSLPDRAQQALTLLTSILMVASVLLVPGQPNWAAGVELAALGVVICLMTARVSVRSLRGIPAEFWISHAAEAGAAVSATALYVVAGVLLAVWGSQGLYLVVPGFLISFLVALIDSWVLLVEINR
jgi:hypothetical protein